MGGIIGLLISSVTSRLIAIPSPTEVTIRNKPGFLLSASTNELRGGGDVDIGVAGEEEEEESAKVEDGKKSYQVKDTALVLAIASLAQVPAPEPIFVPNLGSEASNNLDLLKRAVATSEQIKKHTTDLKKANQKIHAAIEEKNKALQDVAKLQKVASGEVFKKVFDRGYNRTGVLVMRMEPVRVRSEVKLEVDKITVALPAELQDLPEVYSSILLLDFNEEEYANQPPEDDVAQDKELEEGEGENAEDLEGGVGERDLAIPPEE
ncbi:hypothetical protein Acr_00g0025110 [Actinidia rufa]|uniref:Uncharacterized protein n=1 Tax=Actinidia rufa TaxID=165716 RepID=A0A7J0DD98_9ERIC|nr:hypothetical protein Acr_00g0025110 [Actinidia rufa]